jgi:UDP-xylose/UDP-N-acetylglucosamine transporter B4
MAMAAAAAAVPVGCVFGGCGSAGVLLETILAYDPTASYTLHLLYVFFVSALGWSEARHTPQRIPWLVHLLLATLFFITQHLHTAALEAGITHPVHLCLRSGSLVATFLVGHLAFAQSYTARQFACILLISCGIATVLAANDSVLIQRSSAVTASLDGWNAGTLYILLSLFLSAAMGQIQEASYARWGRADAEMLFFTHLLSLPFFVASFYLYHHPSGGGGGGGGAGSTLPSVAWSAATWTGAAGWVLSQWLCIRSVYWLTRSHGTLACTLLLTLRKFLSLLLSILLFRNPWTYQHTFGAAAVFGGTLFYTK